MTLHRGRLGSTKKNLREHAFQEVLSLACWPPDAQGERVAEGPESGSGRCLFSRVRHGSLHRQLETTTVISLDDLDANLLAFLQIV